MAHKQAAPSSRTRRPRGRRYRTPREWIGGVQLSGFVIVILLVAIFGVLVLAPTIKSYVTVRQQVAQAQQGVDLTKEEIERLQLERDQWKDPAFIQSEARERLFYMNPGEIVYLVQDDLPEVEDEEPAPVSAEAKASESDWMGAMLRSITESGLAENVTVPDDSTPEK